MVCLCDARSHARRRLTKNSSGNFNEKLVEHYFYGYLSNLYADTLRSYCMHAPMCILCLQHDIILKTQNKAPAGVLLPAVVKYFMREKWKIQYILQAPRIFAPLSPGFTMNALARCVYIVNDLVRRKFCMQYCEQPIKLKRLCESVRSCYRP